MNKADKWLLILRSVDTRMEMLGHAIVEAIREFRRENQQVDLHDSETLAADVHTIPCVACSMCGKKFFDEPVPVGPEWAFTCYQCLRARKSGVVPSGE